MSRALRWLWRRTNAWGRFTGWLFGAGTAWVALNVAVARSSWADSGLDVAVLGVSFFAMWIPLVVVFFVGLASDYAQRGRAIAGLALADAAWTLERARWPPFTSSLAVFVTLVTLIAFAGIPLGAEFPRDGSTTIAVVSTSWALAAAAALAAGLLGSAGAPRGAVLEQHVLLVDRWPVFRSIPLAEIAHAALAPDERFLLLRLRGGGTVAIPVGAGRAPAARELVAALKAQLGSRWAEPDSDPSRWTLLDRAGDSLDAWRARVAALARGDDYRAPSISREDLRRVLRALDTPAERRIAAALALRAVGAGPDVAAEVAAMPASRMRVALEAIDHDAVDAEQIDQAIAEERRLG